ncbi:roadblock/LC7 domain-containing protein [Tsukamurella pulmonis]|uniref:roadblock/LC7 domain-containing protein n=2 Tax=Tsukamurella pulmonis TaxID=47312 RepID=UPI000AEBED15|nr:hypothetical protein [Tsukamurella pulmonis]
MSGPRRPSNRQRVEDYYGVHDTGMGSRPAPAPGGPPPQGGPTVPPPAGPPPRPVQGAQPRRVIPPPEEQVAAKAARAAGGAPTPPGAPSGPPPGAPAPEAPRSKPDPLTDPLTSETFQGVQPASDTFEAGVVGDYGYSASPGPQAPSASATSFDGGFDQFAPPRFEPRAEGVWSDATPSHADGETYEATFEAHHESETLDEPDESYIDVEVVDVEVHVAPEPVAPEPAAEAAPEPAAEDVPAADDAAVDDTDGAADEVPETDVAAAATGAEAPDDMHHAEFAEQEAAPSDRPEAAGDAVTEPTVAAPGAADADSDGTVDPGSEEVDSAAEDAPATEQAPPRFAEPLAIDPFPYTQIDETYVDAETLESIQHLQAPHEAKEPGDMTEFNESLTEAMNIDGALGVALVDAQSGMALATAGDPAEFNLEVAAAGNSALVQAMGRTLGDLDLDDHIEDILITLGTQYQIVRPINQGTDDLFLYLVLDRSRANLALARFRLTKLAETIEL